MRLSDPEVRLRGWQGLFSLCVWLLTKVAIAFFAAPLWIAIWFPVPALLLAVDAMGPSPWFLKGRTALHYSVYRVLEGVLIGAACLIGIGAIMHPTPRSDQPLTLTCAARDLTGGVDPYTTYEPQCESELQYSGNSATPLMTGPFAADRHYPSVSQILRTMHEDERDGRNSGFPPYGYPPEAASLLVPVAFAGWQAISVWVAIVSLACLLAVWSGRSKPQLVLVAWQLAGLALIWLPFGWNPEIISYLILALAFARIDQPRFSAGALALATLTNPIAWLVAPVYLGITHHEPLWRRRVTWLLGCAIAGTLPWLVWDHSLLVQLWRFVTLPTFPIGAAVGVLLPLPTPWRPVLTATFIATILVCAAISWRSRSWRWSMAVAVWGAFLLSWRGPIYYYFAIFWLSPAVLIGWYRIQRPNAVHSPNPPAVGAGGGPMVGLVPQLDRPRH